jgi:hypothetical protein
MYLTFQPGGEVLVHHVDPTFDVINEHLGGTGDKVHLPFTPDSVMWMREDAFSAAERGEIGCNIPAAVTAMTMGGNPQPYPGVLVMTNLASSVDGELIPAGLEPVVAMAAVTAYDEIKRFLAGESVPGIEIDPDLVERFRQFAAIAAGPVGPAAMYVVDSDDDFLELLRGVGRQ